MLFNPKAGRGKSIQMATRIGGALRAAGLQPRQEIDATRGLPEAAVVIGGDGTLRFYAAKLLEAFGQVPPIVVIPGGTANLMDRHLNLQWEPALIDREVVQTIRDGKIQRLDAAKANDAIFLLIAGIGFDAAVVAALDRVRTGPITMWSYVRPALQTLWQATFLPLSVTIDGEPAFGPAPGMVFVGNVKEYGTGFPVLPLAESNDGVLDVCILPCSSHEDLLRLALHTVAGDHPTLEGAKYRKATHITVTADTPVPVQLDGDSAGMTPVTIELLPIKVPFMVRENQG